MIMRLTLMLGLLVSVSVVPAIAEAAPRRYYHYREPYYPRHDGLFLRLDAGLGGVRADDALNDVTLSGGSVFFSLDVGGAVAPNLALHGRLAINSMFEPAISSGGEG